MIDSIIYSMSDLPVQQNRVYASAQEAIACPCGSITLKQDPLTGIVHNVSFRPDLVVYDTHYQNEQGHSGVFQQHLIQVSEIIQRHSLKKSILEIGCGKGTFLELMRRRGFSVVGIDPAYEGDAPYIIKQPFSPTLGITGDAIILRHVIEHIPDPLLFLATIFEANGGKGLVYIEVPSLEWIADHRAWFDIFYEHVNYFRLSDLSQMFGTVLESGCFFGGQYLYLVADLSTLRMRPKGELYEFHLPIDFYDSVDRAIAKVRNREGQKNIVWGAASKGVIFSLQLLRRRSVTPDIVIDINPAKQGKYLPVTGLPVLSPHDGLSQSASGDTIFIMNSNYFTEIQSLAGDNYTFYKVDQNEL
jgi:SAM-dependent methyltransferase